MSFRTNPDRILESIDRARSRERDAPLDDNRQAGGRELDTTPPAFDATTPERTRRIFRLVEQGYTTAAGSGELGRLASRFRAIGDIPKHRARGDVSVAIRYLDSPRSDDIGMSPFEILPVDLQEMKKTSETSRVDVNALKVLREELRRGVMAAYGKIENRVRDAIRERADMGHLEVEVTMDLRPSG